MSSDLAVPGSYISLLCFFEPPGSLAVCSMQMVPDICRTVLIISRILDFLTMMSPEIDLSQTRFFQSLGLAWASEFLAPQVPLDTLSLPGALGSLSFVALSLT
jgi:hypothetical protein